eukprot:573740-Rhodomonas_salina.1
MASSTRVPNSSTRVLIPGYPGYRYPGCWMQCHYSECAARVGELLRPGYPGTTRSVRGCSGEEEVRVRVAGHCESVTNQEQSWAITPLSVTQPRDSDTQQCHCQCQRRPGASGNLG